MRAYYLAVDIGASSGRHILGWMEDGKLCTEEIYRFANGMREEGKHKCWDTETLFREIKEGMKRCCALGKVPASMGIDTWAVDFVLLDGEGRQIGSAVAYRDGRTEGMDAGVSRVISEEELYARTGIQKQIFNTVYQLEALREKEPELLERAEHLLMIPDYFHYLLTGRMACEYTNATTTQLVSPATKDWDWELIGELGFPRRLFLPIRRPGEILGNLTQEVIREVGFDCRVVLPATHDTGSAVLAVPSGGEDGLYISSGTWSLMGVELPQADCGQSSRLLNFTNEGGYQYRFRYLKNIMGLWMIQSVKKELEEQGERYSFEELCTLAADEAIPSAVDCNDGMFLAPRSMIRAVQMFCQRTGQQVPATAGELAAVIYRSLAGCYSRTAAQIEAQTRKTYGRIHIVGGGSKADYLNRLTAQAAQKEVWAGPSEATAVGNLLVQMLEDGVWAGLEEARRCVGESFAVKVYRPQGECTGQTGGKVGGKAGE